jgi:hypothetical protein
MHDEETRKYLQSVKRLMTFAQRRWPSTPSMSLDFNSGHNGWDKASLMALEGTVDASGKKGTDGLLGFPKSGHTARFTSNAPFDCCPHGAIHSSCEGTVVTGCPDCLPNTRTGLTRQSLF